MARDPPVPRGLELDAFGLDRAGVEQVVEVDSEVAHRDVFFLSVSGPGGSLSLGILNVICAGNHWSRPPPTGTSAGGRRPPTTEVSTWIQRTFQAFRHQRICPRQPAQSDSSGLLQSAPFGLSSLRSRPPSVSPASLNLFQVPEILIS